RHDFVAFASDEMELRRRVGLPPFGRLARIITSHPRDQVARESAEAVLLNIQATAETLVMSNVEALGPTPCVLTRLRGQYRYDLLLRTPDTAALSKLLGFMREKGLFRSKAKTTIVDVDPVQMT
ncbi:MAG: hypothetical protein AABZ47_07830, partial [Planctomycetota bacterium]